MNVLLSPEQLWSGYNNPEADLNTERSEVSDDGSKLRGQIFIDGRIVDKSASRVSLRFARQKEGENQPAVIILGRPGKSVSDEERDFYADGGFLAVSVDYSACDGESPSVYPEKIGYCVFGNCGRHYDFVDSDASETVWYNWAYNVRRTVHFLITEEKCPSVSVVSYGEASKISAMVCAVDDRVYAGAVLFGNVREECKPEKGNLQDADANAIAAYEGKAEEEALRRITGIAPQTYMHLIKIPFLVLNGTNSTVTDTAANAETAESVTGDNCSVALIPRGIDAASPKYAEYVRRWLTKPDRRIDIPVEAFLREGELVIKADLSALTSVSEVRLFYRRGDKDPATANWIEIKDSVHLFDSCEGSCEVVDPKEPVLFFCNAVQMGKLVSSNLGRVVPKDLGEVRTAEKSRILYKGKQGRGEFVSLDPTVPLSYAFLRDNPVSAAFGPYEVSGVKGRYLSTFCLNDSKYVFDESMTLNFDVYAKEQGELSVYITTMWGTEERCLFRNVQKIVGGDLWQKISFPVSELKLLSGKAVYVTMEKVLLSFCSEQEIIINNLLVI